jgi:hypothetical protein
VDIDVVFRSYLRLPAPSADNVNQVGPTSMQVGALVIAGARAVCVVDGCRRYCSSRVSESFASASVKDWK